MFRVYHPLVTFALIEPIEIAIYCTLGSMPQRGRSVDHTCIHTQVTGAERSVVTHG